MDRRELAVAKTIFATPPSSTYDKALHYFLKAEEISPHFYSTNTYYIAETHEKMGSEDEALKYYMDAFKMPVIAADDKRIPEKVITNVVEVGAIPNTVRFS
ncbi:unnamed protein product [Cylicocyclus nassatus]|uniref:Regulator of microtubule dynamics protein 1 n=1 Tax=Cylicocyclus nassatus TaxID=53992 RepID=A0AA36GQ82_CYLNA|nr:unnamed protein product [Cylicocyclus nassatus]